MEGQAVSHFNEKGRDGYAFLNYALYDEPNKEVFIVDNISHKIFVYTEDGGRKRTLQFPYSMYIKEISNFDANTLLAFHEHQEGSITYKQPYIFISKKEGSILSRLNITTDKANPRRLKISNGNSGTTYTIVSSSSLICKYGQEFFLANMSCDTIYLLTQDKTLTPLFVQSPTVFSEPPIITTITMKTDSFISFYVSPFDLKKVRREHEGGKKSNLNDESKQLIYEFKTGQFYELERVKYTAEMVEVPANTAVGLMYPYMMKDWLEKGYLNGELKEVAAKVNYTDNPVVRIAKFK
jgi:hypothetical protein